MIADSINFTGTGKDLESLLLPAVKALPEDIFMTTPRRDNQKNWLAGENLSAKIDSGKVSIFPRHGYAANEIKIPDGSTEIVVMKEKVFFSYKGFSYEVFDRDPTTTRY